MIRNCLGQSCLLFISATPECHHIVPERFVDHMSTLSYRGESIPRGKQLILAVFRTSSDFARLSQTSTDFLDFFWLHMRRIRSRSKDAVAKSLKKSQEVWKVCEGLAKSTTSLWSLIKSYKVRKTLNISGLPLLILQQMKNPIQLLVCCVIHNFILVINDIDSMTIL